MSSRSVRACDGILRSGATVGALSIWIIAFVVFYDVVMRFAGRPTVWALEVGTYLMIGAAVWASGLGAVENAHFSVRLVPDALRPGPRRVLGFVVDLATAALVAFVCYGFYRILELSIRFDMKSPTLLQVPLSIPQGAMLAGFVVMFVGYLRRLAAPAD